MGIEGEGCGFFVLRIIGMKEAIFNIKVSSIIYVFRNFCVLCRVKCGNEIWSESIMMHEVPV